MDEFAYISESKESPMTIRLIATVITCWLLVSGAYSEEREFTDKERAWWAIQAVRDPVVPAQRSQTHPIDAFVDRKRDQVRLHAAPLASPLEFVRRAYFDLHGLPPTPEQIDAFVVAWENDNQTAIAALIDQLLASPRYGERWAQHWLDVVRYAESDGYREDAFRPDAHRYRDFVIRSFTEDKPYDQFVREQLAADEFAPSDHRTIEATGFLRLGIYEHNQRNAEMQRELMINEMTNLTGEVFLGVGIACARCHDHKFDPLLQRDYFALQAFLSSTIWPTDRRLGSPEQLEAYATWERSGAPIRAQMEAMLEQPRRRVQEKHVKTFPPKVQAMYWKPEGARSSYEQQISMLVQRQVDREEAKVDAAKTLADDGEKLARYSELEGRLAALAESRPPLPTAFISTDTGTSPALTYMGAGEEKSVVEPAYFSLLGAPAPAISPGKNTTGRRSALASWIASTDNPLAARVFTNRIWQYHFGTGLVATPNDFGTLGEPPSHPELLDWLTSRFVEGGWKMKPLHRLIMTSETYRQTSRHEPDEVAELTDPANRLLWRFPPARLSAEQVRDSMLSVSGELEHRMNGGPSVNGSEPARSIYIKKQRNTPEEFLHCFDAPVGFDSAPQRLITTTATQALLLANGDWPMARARAFARRLLGKEKSADRDHITQAYRLALGREPSGSEIEAGLEFIAGQTEEIREFMPTSPAPKFPDENGLRHIAQNFSKVGDQGLGERALWLQPGSRFEQLHLKEVALGSDSFTIEAVAQLDSIHKDASVNTLVSCWNGDHAKAGWTIGVTSEKSSYKPRNLIAQLVGSKPAGGTGYEVIASNLYVPTGRPVLISAKFTPGKITFGLRDLATPDSPSETIEVQHELIGGFQSRESRLLIGGRDQKENAHLWDGQIGKLTIASDGSQNFAATFHDGDGKQPVPGSEWLQKEQPAPARPDPDREALADFCHALLSSNEFLYLH